MLDPLEILVLALLGVPATGLVLWLIALRLLTPGSFGLGHALLLGALATALTGSAIWFAADEVQLDIFGLALALGFVLSALSIDYADEWGPPIQPYALGCAPLTVGVAIVLGILLLGVDLPPLGDAILLGGLGGPAVALIATLAWLRWGPEGRLGCLPVLIIGVIAAIVIGAIEWYYYDEWAPPELLTAVVVAGLLGLGVGGFLDRYRPGDEPRALGCLPPLGTLGILALIVALINFGPGLLWPIGIAPEPTSTPGVVAQSPSPVVSSTATPATALPPSPSPSPSPTLTVPPTASPAPTQIPPAERADFLDALVDLGVLSVADTSKIDMASVADVRGDLFKADGQPVDVANPADIQSGFVIKRPQLPETIRDVLFDRCGLTKTMFDQLCGQRQTGEGTVNIIWTGMFEPFGERNGIPVLFADTDTDTSNNGRASSSFPLAPAQAGDTWFQVQLEGNRTVVKMYDNNRPGQFRRTDAILFYGHQSVGWIVFGDYATFTPLIETFESFPDDFADDVLGPLPVAGQPFPAHMPYDITQPCGALCLP